ncbi:MAG: hypothetical protein Q4A66_12285 [Eubacteriales bacterium]|nr:hypothetical protein [Eubacteriales bacterium]
MKKTYTVLYESGYDVTTGHSSYSAAKVLRHEKEAFAFVKDEKNIRQYGEMSLEKRESGHTFTWDFVREEWVS